MSKFSEYVTSTAFNISLSKPMIEMLCEIDQVGFTFAYASTKAAIYERGLVSALPDVGYVHNRFGLTSAGRWVVLLIREAGLYAQVPAWYYERKERIAKAVA